VICYHTFFSSIAFPSCVCLVGIRKRNYAACCSIGFELRFELIFCGLLLGMVTPMLGSTLLIECMVSESTALLMAIDTRVHGMRAEGRV
jgi:hypothetical protein